MKHTVKWFKQRLDRQLGKQVLKQIQFDIISKIHCVRQIQLGSVENQYIANSRIDNMCSWFKSEEVEEPGLTEVIMADLEKVVKLPLLLNMHLLIQLLLGLLLLFLLLL